MTFQEISEQAVPCVGCQFDLRATLISEVCPECGLAASLSQPQRVDGDRLVVRSGAVLPRRCVKTNVAVPGKQTTTTLHYMHPAWGVTILFGPLGLLIVYLIVRQPCRCTYSISPRARRRRGALQAALGVVPIIGLGLMVVGPSMGRGGVNAIWVGGVILLIAGLFAYVAVRHVLRVTRTRNGEFWIKGFGKEFLASMDTEALPVWPSRAMTDDPAS